jgi:hypothetical protein
LSRLALGLGAVLLAACSRAPAIVVDRLEVDAFLGGEVVSMSEAQLRDALVAELKAAKVLVALEKGQLPAGAAPWRVQVAAGVSEPDVEHQSSVLQLALELRHTGDRDGFEVRGHEVVKAPRGNDAEAMEAALRDALSLAIRRAVREATQVIRLDGSTPAELARKLASGEPAERAAAVRLLVRRQDEAALPSLLERLKSEDVDELREVMGLLVELRSPRAVNPLVEAARQRGPLFEREVVFAVGAIGGSDAEAYLDLIATGHDDPVVRASAEQALVELRARKPKPSKGDPTP